MKMKPIIIFAVIDPNGEIVRASRLKKDLTISHYYGFKGKKIGIVGKDRIAKVKIVECST